MPYAYIDLRFDHTTELTEASDNYRCGFNYTIARQTSATSISHRMYPGQYIRQAYFWMEWADAPVTMQQTIKLFNFITSFQGLIGFHVYFIGDDNTTVHIDRWSSDDPYDIYFHLIESDEPFTLPSGISQDNTFRAIIRLQALNQMFPQSPRSLPFTPTITKQTAKQLPFDQGVIVIGG